MNYSALKAAIAQVVRPNDNQEITGENLQGVFNALVNSIAQGYLFAGVATPSTEPGTPDQNVVYLAGAGSYSNFGASITINNGCLGVFAFNGEWTKDIVQIGGSIQGIPSVDIAQLNSLGTPTDQAYINPSVYTVTTLHNLSSTVIKVGTLFVFSDAGRTVVTQILFSNYQVDGGGNISSPNTSQITMYYRMYNIVQETWSAWTLYAGGGGGGTIDPYPVSGSDNPVASNGVFEGLQKAAPEVNINDLDSLGNLVNMRTWLRIGVVMCFANHAQNTLTQIVFSNCVVDGGGNLIPNYATNVMNIYYRFKQFSGNPPEGMTIGVWSAWTKFEGSGSGGEVDAYTKSETDTLLAEKQNTISDLSEIRSGASAGATAVQPTVMNAALNGKQNTLVFDETPTANSNNPVKSQGIKSYVDGKETNLISQFVNYYTKSQVDNLIVPQGVNSVPVTALPATGDANTLYFLQGTNSFTINAWDGSAWVTLATISGAYDAGFALN